MSSLRHLLCVVLVTIALATTAPALAHITPPVVLVSDRDALVTLLSGARRFFVREVRLTDPEKQKIRQQTRWTPDEDFYRFYIGRDEQGRAVAATVFVTEFTIHGPVRVAVALGPDGKVRGATVVELTEETYPWVKPLIERQFTREYVGRDARGTFAVGGDGGDSMTHFYGEVIASLIRRAAVLYEVAVLSRGDAA
jgi:Na+-translocating ferredoxin:NAD+ oxidoreductase RnfG subunit